MWKRESYILQKWGWQSHLTTKCIHLKAKEEEQERASTFTNVSEESFCIYFMTKKSLTKREGFWCNLIMFFIEKVDANNETKLSV